MIPKKYWDLKSVTMEKVLKHLMPEKCQSLNSNNIFKAIIQGVQKVRQLTQRKKYTKSTRTNRKYVLRPLQ